MATRPIRDWLKIEESARLLHAIFPNYPVLYPCRPTPPIEEWPLLIDFSHTAGALITGGMGPTDHLARLG